MFQIVVTCVLLVGSLLQLRSITKQQTIDYGYDTGGLISARMALMDGDYPTQDARKIFYDRVLQDFAADPEFEGVALTNRFRMVFSGNARVELEGRQYREERDRPQANFEQVTGGFFAVTGQKLLEGRTFGADDLDARQPVAIVNAAFAQKHFGNESALGRRFRTYAATAAAHGSVADHRRRGLDRAHARAVQPAGHRRDRLLRAVFLEPGRSGHGRPRSSASSRPFS